MSGRAVALMSGGIDSPVAAYRMMKRGLRCVFLHFSGMPLTGPESVYKAYALVRGLDRFQGASRLYVVPFGKAQQSLASSGAAAAGHGAAAADAEDSRGASPPGCTLALVTGDSLGQVSSQTLPNITALDDAVSPADPAPAARLGQDGDHGRGAPAGTLQSPSCPTRTAARCSPRAGRRPGRRSRTCARSRAAWTRTNWRNSWPRPPRSTARLREANRHLIRLRQPISRGRPTPPV